MSYIIKNLDKLIGIFALITAIIVPENQKKWGIVFIVIAIFIYIIGFISENNPAKQKKWGLILGVIAIIIIMITFFSGNDSRQEETTTIEEQEELDPQDIQSDNDSDEENDQPQDIQTDDGPDEENDQPQDIQADIDSDEEESRICEDVYITDDTFEDGNRGMASLYCDTSKMFPIWFEGDLDDVYLSCIVDNIGSSYASIKNTKLIIDNFEPVTMEEVLLLHEESHAGVPSEVEGDVNLFNISNNRAEYDVNFYVYNDYEEGVEIKLREGQSFNVDQVSQTRFILYPKLLKSGIYTYHIKVDYEYNKTDYSMETQSVSFIYINGDSSDYKYDYNELSALCLNRECYSEETGLTMYYAIEGRTLRVHDTSIISYDNDFGRYFSLIDTILVEEGTEIIEAYAFGEEPGLINVTEVYLPGSLKYIDVDCFYFNLGRLKTIYFGGTEEQWDSLITNSESDRIENIEGVEIICNYEY